MHYVRLFRPIKALPSKGQQQQRLEVVLAITTDLGDAFLFPEEPVPLLATFRCAQTGTEQDWPASGSGDFQWKAGHRMLKPTIPMSPHLSRDYAAGRIIQVCIRPRSSKITAVEARDVVPGAASGVGLVMPAWMTLNKEDRRNVLTRKVETGTPEKPMGLCIDEGIGESIARHIWDAGVVTLSCVAAMASDPNPDGVEVTRGPCLEALRQTLAVQKPLNIMELGCGVGILGLGLSSLLPAFHHRTRDCLVLMTDLDEARAQAESNISHLLSGRKTATVVPLSYENLDWEDGRVGKFGPAVTAAGRWDLIVISDCTYNVDMLPALVETLSALHAAGKGAEGGTKVFLATKPRHSSERALFDLMREHTWDTLAKQVISLPVLGQEAETVELYLFQKP
ncbi:hypothetical protein N3K66_004752 [Trichothecium roseum]|uniref:Uncharacterized protein n=1 Tax=Trichothecium roseum TaxID=47278 RepID=A0ACC0V244_9HYPO|nr:hypothetical protein N3K66_004752 [Trichothecium roseum]